MERQTGSGATLAAAISRPRSEVTARDLRKKRGRSQRKLAESPSSGQNPTESEPSEPAPEELDAQIRQAAREWQETFDAIESPVLLLSWSGVIRRLNRAALGLLGGTFRDWLGKSVPAVGPEPWVSVTTLVERVQRTGLSAASQVVDGEGRAWHLVANQAEIPNPGTPARIVLSLRDVTDLVRLQESLRRSQGLSALGHLLGGVAHEARNPLFAISAVTDALEETRDSTELLPLLRGEVRRLARLMEDLLEYGKPADLREHDLSSVVHSAVASFNREDLRGGRVPAIHLELPDHLPEIRMDPDRLERVFLNLLKNARDCSPPGAAIRLRCQIRETPLQSWILCDIEDSGPGFREDDLARIWEPFYSHRPGGTGLGLSIVQRIVELHGGSVRAENLPGGGARIRLSLGVS